MEHETLKNKSKDGLREAYTLKQMRGVVSQLHKGKETSSYDTHSPTIFREVYSKYCMFPTLSLSLSTLYQSPCARSFIYHFSFII